MLINAYNVENINSAAAGKAVGTGNVQASEKTGFFSVAMEKTGIAQAFQNGYINYDKTGKESGQEQNEKNAPQTKQDILAYINDNIEKLKELVTEEDYSAMSELGLAADKETPQTLITVYERIQIELAAYCEDYDASGLNISSDKIKTVLNSEAMANSVKMADEAGNLTDASKAYLLKNELEPTIANVYKAAHSTRNGSSTQTQHLSEGEWEELKPQISDMMEKSGLEVNEQNLNNAKWLVENNIPVTVENLVKLGELNKAETGNTDVLKTNVTFALMMGMDGTDAFITDGWIDSAERNSTLELVENVSDETIYDIVEDDAVLNAANMKKYQAEEDGAGGDRQQRERDYQNPSFIKAKSIIVEARLVMTSSSLMTMQKVGVSITYTEISVMLAETQQENSEYYASFFENDAAPGMTDSVSNLMDMMKSMSQVPSVVMGEIYSEKIEFTLSSVYEESSRVSSDFTRAEMTYEAVGTQVRADLGDSMAKAFDSIDGILSEQGIEVDESSRRAARILAYNQMEINQESVLKMEGLMEELDYVRDNLTPKAAALLAENQVNILNTDIRELNRNLIELNAMIGADENEDFAKYLWKLEKSERISKEDRDRYVDLYRTLNLVESADSRALGAVVSEGAKMTLNNLLSAVKSREKSGMDVMVDDNFGMNESGYQSAGEDMEEIGDFVKKLAARVKSGLNAENVEKIYKNGGYGGISLGNLVDVVSDNESLRTNERLNAEYVKLVMDTYMKEAAREGITEDTVLTLLEGGHKATMENIISAMELSTPGSDFRKYLLDKKENKKAAENIVEHFEDAESASAAMETFRETASADTAGNAVIDLPYEKMRSLADVNRNLRFMTKSAENESYHIPMEIGGEAVTVRVSLHHGEGEGKAHISMNTLTFGKIDCVIQSVNMVSHVKTEAVVYCETSEMAGMLIGRKSIVIHEIQGIDNAGEFSMQVVRGQENANENTGKHSLAQRVMTAEERKENKVETGYLYKVSKSFIKFVKESLESSR